MRPRGNISFCDTDKIAELRKYQEKYNIPDIGGEDKVLNLGARLIHEENQIRQEKKSFEREFENFMKGKRRRVEDVSEEGFPYWRNTTKEEDIEYFVSKKHDLPEDEERMNKEHEEIRKAFDFLAIQYCRWDPSDLLLEAERMLAREEDEGE